MKKVCQVVMLPTSDPKEFGVICKDISGEDSDIGIKQFGLYDHDDYVTQHLYILSNDTISTGEICYHQPSKTIVNYPEGGFPENHTFKVIASTARLNKVVDIFETLPLIDADFVSRYVKHYNKQKQIKYLLVEFNEKNQPLIIDNKIVISAHKYNWTFDEVFDLLKSYRSEFSLHRGIQIMDSDLDDFIGKYSNTK